MLILSRKSQEKIIIADNIVVTVCQIRGDKVRLGIDAPRDIPIVRSELLVSDEETAQEGDARPCVSSQGS